MRSGDAPPPETRAVMRRLQRRIVIMLIVQTIVIVGAIKLTPGPYCMDLKAMIASDSRLALLRNLGCR